MLSKRDQPDGVARPVSPTPSTQWPHTDSLHRLDLDGVVGDLERTFVAKHPAPDMAKQILAAARSSVDRVGIGCAPLDRNLFKELGLADELPTELTFGERLADLLPVIWADYRIWQVFAMKPPENPILKNALVAHTLLKFYNLQIPFSDSVWLQLRKERTKWHYLQFLMVSNASRFFHLESASKLDELSDVERLPLNKHLLGLLLENCCRNPLQDWRPELWYRQLPPTSLFRISQAARKLGADAAWCAKNPNPYLAQRAPVAGNHRAHY